VTCGLGGGTHYKPTLGMNPLLRMSAAWVSLPPVKAHDGSAISDSRLTRARTTRRGFWACQRPSDGVCLGSVFLTEAEATRMV